MPEALLVAVILILLSSLFLLSPVMMNRSVQRSSRSGVNIEFFKGRLIELESDRARGILDDSEFEQLKTDQKVCLPLANNRGGDSVAEAYMAIHAAAPLGHAMDFRFLDVVSLMERSLHQNSAGQEHPLSSYTSKNYVRCHQEFLPDMGAMYSGFMQEYAGA